MAWLLGGWAKVWLGEPEVALERLARAIRLSPQDPQMFGMETATACAHFFAGREAEAATWAERALRQQSNYFIAVSVFAASCALAGRSADAQKAMERLLHLDPGLRRATLREVFPIRQSEHFTRFAEGLHKAGLPD